MGSRLAHRLRGGTAQPIPDFRGRIERVLSTLGDAVVDCHWVSVGPTAEPWVVTEIPVQSGQSLSFLADGVIHASRSFDVGFGPAVGLWYRLGDAEVAKVVGAASTICAARAGPLRFAAKPPGEFATSLGAFDPAQSRPSSADLPLGAPNESLWRGVWPEALSRRCIRSAVLPCWGCWL